MVAQSFEVGLLVVARGGRQMSSARGTVGEVISSFLGPEVRWSDGRVTTSLPSELRAFMAGATVEAMREITDDHGHGEVVVAKRGVRGIVVHVDSDPDAMPAVRWDDTDCVSCVFPEDILAVSAEKIGLA